MPSRLTWPIMSCVARATSKSSQPSPWIFLISSSLPAKSAPASLALATLSPWQKTSTRTDLPTPCGKGTLPRIIWSLCVVSMPSDMWISTVSSNLARLICLSSAMACLSGAAPSLAIFWWSFLIWLRSFLPRRGGWPGCWPFFLVRSAGPTRWPRRGAGAAAASRRQAWASAWPRGLRFRPWAPWLLGGGGIFRLQPARQVARPWRRSVCRRFGGSVACFLAMSRLCRCLHSELCPGR